MKIRQVARITDIAAVTLYEGLAIVQSALSIARGSTALMMTGAVMLLFALFAVLALISKLPLLWLVLGVGGVILSSCSNNARFMPNVCVVLQTATAFAAGIAGCVLWIFHRGGPSFKLSHIAAYACFAAVAIVIACVCAGSAAAVNVKTGAAETEVWAVPDIYDSAECPERGRVERVEYETKAYATDSRAVTKAAYVYLPYGYDESKQYDILYLMHGTGDDERYWLKDHPENVTMLDNLIYRRDIAPLIAVTPTWYVENDCADDLDVLTYSFKDELRRDLVPLIETKYSTYAASVEEPDLIASRDHRAFAGLSRGSATTFHSAINGSLDIFSYFGCFSGSLTSESEFDEGMRSENFRDYSVNYFYNTSGTFDFLLSEHLSTYKRLLSADPRLQEGVNCSFDVFPAVYHNHPSWHIALYNYLQKIFKK